ncbi:hypothetical protein GCM10022291_27990 [Postechiella marina]|uniref:Lipoprotein n=1 Tax=Postechiella marina TaxID=943941 RepID=A0ABP8CF10_9FLAO
MKNIILILVATTLVNCKYLSLLHSDKNLTKKIETEFLSDAKIVDFSNFDTFAWDELLILAPYSSINLYEKELQLNLKNIRGHKIEMYDSFNLIVFLKNGKSVKISEFPLLTGYFKNSGIRIKKDNAKFIISSNKSIQLVK